MGVEENVSGGEGSGARQAMLLQQQQRKTCCLSLAACCCQFANVARLPVYPFIRFLQPPHPPPPLLLHVASCGLAGSHSSAYFISLADLLDSHPIKL